VLGIEGKLANTSFPSLSNVVVGNALVFELEGKLVDARFPAWWNVVES
jgi:hypothetical protein